VERKDSTVERVDLALAQPVSCLASRHSGVVRLGGRLRLRLLLDLAGRHTGLKHAPHQLLRGTGDGGAALANPVAEPRYAQELNELTIVQVQLRLVASEHGVYGVAEPLGTFLFVHPASPVLPRFQDSTARAQSSVNVRRTKV
jgi:hypothetical protein